MDELGYQRLAENQAAHWWYQGRRAILRGVLARYLGDGTDRMILEIGAGAGSSIDMLQTHGRVEAVEMDDASRAVLTELHPDIEVRGGALPNAEIFGGKDFDAVMMFDVLEHVPEERASLEAIRTHMTPGGHLVITVPAYEWLWSQMDVVAHHQRRYTRARLREALEATGWEVKHLSHFNTFLFPLAVAARVKDKLSKSDVSTGLEMPGSAVNTVFKTIFSSERPIVKSGGFPFGLSIVAVATPRVTQ